MSQCKGHHFGLFFAICAHLVCDALIVFYVLAEIHGRIPDAVLVVEATAALLRVLVLRDSNFVPGELRSNKFVILRTIIEVEAVTSSQDLSSLAFPQ